jgi:hypothetical protein
MRRLGPLLPLLFAAAPARAVDVAANAGAIEVVGVPGPVQLGLYPYVGISFAIAVPHLTLIPGLAVEWSPEIGHDGGVVSLVVDYGLNDRVGIDANVTFIHDQPGFHFDQSNFYLGIGAGCSVFLGKWTVSLAFDVFHGLNVSSWSLVPGFNVAWTF